MKLEIFSLSGEGKYLYTTNNRSGKKLVESENTNMASRQDYSAFIKISRYWTENAFTPLFFFVYCMELPLPKSHFHETHSKEVVIFMWQFRQNMLQEAAVKGQETKTLLTRIDGRLREEEKQYW